MSDSPAPAAQGHRGDARGNQAVIAIGSNIDPRRNVDAAISRIGESLCVLGSSRFVVTRPVGPAGQDDFLNGCVLVETAMSLDELRAWLRLLETTLGRVRTADKYAPRTIDLDIVVWNGLIVDEDVRTREYLRDAVNELLPDVVDCW